MNTAMGRPYYGGDTGTQLMMLGGTASSDLAQLQAPALFLLAQIQQRTSYPTQVVVLHGPHRFAAAHSPVFDALQANMVEVTITESLPTEPSFEDPAEWVRERTHASESFASTPVDLETVEGIIEPAPATSPAFSAFKELARWLSASDPEIAELVGIGRTTPYTWKREGREPHRSTVRRLYQVHSLLSALVKRLGEDAAVRWLALGDPSRRERLLVGDSTSVQQELRDVLFSRARPRTRPGSWVPMDEELSA